MKSITCRGSAILGVGLSICLASSAFAQSGGGGGSSGGGAGGSSGGTSTGAPGQTGASPSTGSPGAIPGGSLNSRSAAPQALPGDRSTAPQRPMAVPPVPSAGNAEPTSPINRQNRELNARDPQDDPSDTLDRTDASEPLDPTPRTDPVIGGSGNRGAIGPGDVDSKNLDVSRTRSADSIGEEPERVQRKGGATGRTLDECMTNWDDSTHMTREQWKTTCQRLGR